MRLVVQFSFYSRNWLRRDFTVKEAGMFVRWLVLGFILSVFSMGCDGPFHNDESPKGCEENPCDENVSCSRVRDSVECLCNDGFDGDGCECRDVNECYTFAHACERTWS